MIFILPLDIIFLAGDDNPISVRLSPDKLILRKLFINLQNITRYNTHSAMNSIAKYLVFLLIVTTLYSCSSQKPVNYSKTHSYGFQHNDHVYFLLDYQVWRKGGRFWFIMPFQLPSKIYLKLIPYKSPEFAPKFLINTIPFAQNGENVENIKVFDKPERRIGYCHYC